ncbi:MAG TPA: NAD-dependent epimerase/dehydratase family protein [Thermoanaerobaculia bacterium]|nr:NAD-dependent epimerase/dehydratase family protein [Thermoanaerobaculia bacterium]
MSFGDLDGRRVLVTGGSGFIGGRLVERLVRDEGARVRVLVRNPASAVRLARFPLEFVHGDVTDPRAAAAAVDGCEVVFHCAYGTSGSQRHRAFVNRGGTEGLLEAAAGARLRRFVHLSTLMVYGQTGDGDLTEEAPRRRFGNAYSDSKLAAERLALGAARSGRVPVTVLQPTAVYGPYGGVWTEQVLAGLKAGRAILVNGGEGLANHVYVDDLVTAMLLAGRRDEAVGEAFLISAAEPTSWKGLYGCFERMLGSERTASLTEAEALALWRETRRARPFFLGELLRLIKTDRGLRDRLFETRELRFLRERASDLLPERLQQRIKAGLGGGHGVAAAEPELPIHPLSPSMIGFFRPKTYVRIDKARRLLGYRPAFTLEQGMALTEAWARWAGLLGEAQDSPI